MKKNYSLAALILIATAFTACNSESELIPEVGYGYIELVNITTDATVETRAEQTEGDLSKWTAVVKNSSNETAFSDLASKLATHAFTEGTYSLEVYNYVDDATASAVTDNNGTQWGAARYQGPATTQTFNVTKGTSVPVEVKCGKAKNARLGVTFNSSFTGVVATGYKLTTTDARALEFNADNTTGTNTKYAYYAASTSESTVSVPYKLEYTFKGSSKTVTGSVAMGAAATQKTLNVSLNSNGTVTLTIKYDDEFTNSTEDITIDGATGDKEKPATGGE